MHRPISQLKIRLVFDVFVLWWSLWFVCIKKQVRNSSTCTYKGKSYAGAAMTVRFYYGIRPDLFVQSSVSVLHSSPAECTKQINALNP
jgi:hypothetical protein